MSTSIKKLLQIEEQPGAGIVKVYASQTPTAAGQQNAPGYARGCVWTNVLGAGAGQVAFVNTNSLTQATWQPFA